MTVNVLELREISKSFPGVQALSNVSLIVRPGTVHAICGENGAGKSTLIKIATGAQSADSGVIQICGDRIDHASRRTVQNLGVRAIFQERQIAPDLSVTENVLLDRLPKRFGRVDWKNAKIQARQRMDALEISLDIDTPVRNLSVAQLQMMEIARAVSLEARLIVMDEPTASLSRHELEPLFRVINKLRDGGVSVLFISHHLDEVFEIADEITVMRDGVVVSHGEISEFTPASIAELMFGRKVSSSQTDRMSQGDLSQPRLVINKVCSNRLNDVSLSVSAGEIVSVTGGIGAGVSELARMAAGGMLKSSGEILVYDDSHGSHAISSRRQALNMGVAYLPADRKRKGLLLERALSDNIVLGQQAAGSNPILTPRKVSESARAIAPSANIKAANVDVVVGTLSGGNQQKVMIGRWMGVNARIMIFDEPTAGIDIASKFEIYSELRRLADSGVAILICSTDFQEVGQVSDRVIVMRSGNVVGEVEGSKATEGRLLEMEMSK